MVVNNAGVAKDVISRTNAVAANTMTQSERNGGIVKVLLLAIVIVVFYRSLRMLALVMLLLSCL